MKLFSCGLKSLANSILKARAFGTPDSAETALIPNVAEPDKNPLLVTFPDMILPRLRGRWKSPFSRTLWWNIWLCCCQVPVNQCYDNIFLVSVKLCISCFQCTTTIGSVKLYSLTLKVCGFYEQESNRVETETLYAWISPVLVHPSVRFRNHL